MQSPFDFAHLDPSSDPPERYQIAFTLLSDLWHRLRSFRQRDCEADPLLHALVGRLEHQLVAAGLILHSQVEFLRNNRFIFDQQGSRDATIK
jgi:hypothetical protein